MDAMTFDELDYLLECVRQNADARWRHSCRECIRVLAATGQSFTADDVHDLMKGNGFITASKNAMGAMFNAARRQGIIISDNVYRPSERRDAHRRMVRVWRGPK